MTRLAYSILVEPLSEEEGGGYLARVPELDGCMSDGETPEEAVAHARDAIEAWLDVARGQGWDIPTPAPLTVLTRAVA